MTEPNPYNILDVMGSLDGENANFAAGPNVGNETYEQTKNPQDLFYNIDDPEVSAEDMLTQDYAIKLKKSEFKPMSCAESCNEAMKNRNQKCSILAQRLKEFGDQAGCRLSIKHIPEKSPCSARKRKYPMSLKAAIAKTQAPAGGGGNSNNSNVATTPVI